MHSPCTSARAAGTDRPRGSKPRGRQRRGFLLLQQPRALLLPTRSGQLTEKGKLLFNPTLLKAAQAKPDIKPPVPRTDLDDFCWFPMRPRSGTNCCCAAGKRRAAPECSRGARTEPGFVLEEHAARWLLDDEPAQQYVYTRRKQHQLRRAAMGLGGALRPQPPAAPGTRRHPARHQLPAATAPVSQPPGAQGADRTPSRARGGQEQSLR